jgi:hypothetical protein
VGKGRSLCGAVVAWPDSSRGRHEPSDALPPPAVLRGAEVGVADRAVPCVRQLALASSIIVAASTATCTPSTPATGREIGCANMPRCRQPRSNQRNARGSERRNPAVGQLAGARLRQDPIVAGSATRRGWRSTVTTAALRDGRPTERSSSVARGSAQRETRVFSRNRAGGARHFHLAPSHELCAQANEALRGPARSAP